MSDMAQTIALARRPGVTIQSDDFEILTNPLPELQDDDVQVRNQFISVDPYMRLALSDRGHVPAAKPVGEPMTGGAVGIVEASRCDSLPVGTIVTSQMGWRDCYVAKAATVQPVPSTALPNSYYLGILGLTGLTAYAGIEYILKPKAGDKIFISGAAGAVGSVAAQLAKKRGCTVLATAGSDDKVAWLRDTLKLDAVVNYNSAEISSFLAEHAPEGIDHYFDNVGGPTLDAAITAIKPRGQIVIVGAISQYNSENFCAGPGEFFKISEKGLTVVGLNVSMYYDRAKEAFADLAQRLTSGELIWEETVVHGLENAPEAFVSLFSGNNRGKLIIALEPKA